MVSLQLACQFSGKPLGWTQWARLGLGIGGREGQWEEGWVWRGLTQDLPGCLCPYICARGCYPAKH